MTEYTKAIALADRSIRKKGRAITLRRFIKTPPENAWDKPITVNQDHETVGVFLFGIKENRSGEVIEQEYESVMVPALNLPITPTTDDVVIDGGVNRVIIKVKAMRPGDEEVFHRLDLKQ